MHTVQMKILYSVFSLVHASDGGYVWCVECGFNHVRHASYSNPLMHSQSLRAAKGLSSFMLSAENSHSHKY